MKSEPSQHVPVMLRTMTLPVILVAGLGRCGTSMVMQMLAAAGWPTLGRYPDYEEDDTVDPQPAAWWAAHAGHAVKLLDPQRVPPAPGVPYRAILLSREPHAQAASQMGLIQTMFPGVVSRRARRAMAVSIAQDQPRAAAALARVTDHVLMLDFDWIRADPLRAAKGILSFCHEGFELPTESNERAAAAAITTPGHARAVERAHGL